MMDIKDRWSENDIKTFTGKLESFVAKIELLLQENKEASYYG